MYPNFNIKYRRTQDYIIYYIFYKKVLAFFEIYNIIYIVYKIHNTIHLEGKIICQIYEVYMGGLKCLRMLL